MAYSKEALQFANNVFDRLEQIAPGHIPGDLRELFKEIFIKDYTRAQQTGWFVKIGFRSLRTAYATILGREKGQEDSHADERNGDIVRGHIPGLRESIVYSDKFRGNPFHPGAVGTATETGNPSDKLEAVALRIPFDDLDRAVTGAANWALLELGENHIRPTSEQYKGEDKKFFMYMPQDVTLVTEDGTEIVGAVCLTPLDSYRNPYNPIYRSPDQETLSRQAIAQIIDEGIGGFTVDPATRERLLGGSTRQYFDNFHEGLDDQTIEDILFADDRPDHQRILFLLKAYSILPAGHNLRQEIGKLFLTYFRDNKSVLPLLENASPEDETFERLPLEEKVVTLDDGTRKKVLAVAASVEGGFVSVRRRFYLHPALTRQERKEILDEYTSAYDEIEKEAAVRFAAQLVRQYQR